MFVSHAVDCNNSLHSFKGYPQVALDYLSSMVDGKLFSLLVR